jgi:hypothetical protein
MTFVNDYADSGNKKKEALTGNEPSVTVQKLYDI